MRNRKRLTNILIAGTLTVLMLTVFLAFRGSDTPVAEAEATNIDETAVTELVGEYETDIAALQAQVESLQAQNAAYQAQNEELRTAVTTLQERESEYQAQIETANQTINELSAQNNNLAMGGEGFDALQPRPHGHDH